MTTSQRVLELLQRIVYHWNMIYIRVYQDGKWQSLPLQQVTDGKQVARWVINFLKHML